MANVFKAKYDEHHAEVASEFMKWYRNGTYVDVTIHTGGQRVRAHKLVLAASSPFFNGIFLESKLENSHLYFNDVPFQSMKSLIEYMYSGELVVEREFLPTCLQLGDSLRVKGISGNIVDDVLTEPAVVSEKMFDLINSIMQQYPQPPAQQLQIIQPEPVAKKVPIQSRNEQTRHRRKYNKLSNQGGESTDKGAPPIPSKLVFKRIRNTNGYKLKQFCSPTHVDDQSGQKDSAVIPEQHNLNAGIVNLGSYAEIQSEVKPNIHFSAIEATSKEQFKTSPLDIKRDPSKEENENYDNDKYEMVASSANMPIIPMYLDHDIVEKMKADDLMYLNALHHPVSRLKTEGATRKKGKQATNEGLILTKNEATVIKKNVVIKADENIGLPPAVIFRATPALNVCKPKKHKRVARFSPLNLDQEIKQLFGMSPKEENNDPQLTIKVSLSRLALDGKEILKHDPPEGNMEEECDENEGEFKKKIGNRRRTPICPPPEDIFKNGKPSFSCALCKRVYTHKSNYRRHYMVFHKRCAEAIFQCPMCKKKFTRSDNRTHHLRRIHGYTSTASILSDEQALYSCPICNKAFTRSYNRTFHLVEQHGIESPELIDKQAVAIP